MKRSVLFLLFALLLSSFSKISSQELIDTTTLEFNIKYTVIKTDGSVIIGTLVLQNAKDLIFELNNKTRVSIPRQEIKKLEKYIVHIIIKHDGTEFIGKIISQDSREILIDTENMGEVIIPKHEVQEIRELTNSEINRDGKYIPEEVFSTRYFISTNGLPIEKGESYVQWNLFGPDFQFGVQDNFGLGVMTSWFGMPIIGSAKYTFKLGENSGLAIGTLLGTGSWAAPDFGFALPYTAYTLGDRRANFTISAGYGAVWGEGGGEGRFLLSIAGMSSVGKNISLVFDSFIVPSASDDSFSFTLLVPGIRWQIKDKNAFQFGFGGVIFDGELAPIPIPMVQWFRKIN
ncbi:MAG: hypothetical protein U9R19_14860 [Bacteroidota bacterium]|nr:hypothetical protein [Bacteroidota bacterium]